MSGPPEIEIATAYRTQLNFLIDKGIKGSNERLNNLELFIESHPDRFKPHLIPLSKSDYIGSVDTPFWIDLSSLGLVGNLRWSDVRVDETSIKPNKYIKSQAFTIKSLLEFNEETENNKKYPLNLNRILNSILNNNFNEFLLNSQAFSGLNPYPPN